ncbi:MAG: type II toxin-antitoxin system VapC family toxin [Planctomycetes bacterium]|nr:type II toxin-antitoxin system VapC family toxin [Planctomycetota bacterium]
MNFTAIPSGTSLFLDANVFIYAYADDPAFGSACTDLLERIELKDLQGFISAHVFGDIAHRIMTLEACQVFGWPYAGVARRLRRHPQEVQKLKEFRQMLDDIVTIGIHILPIHAHDVLAAGDLSIKHGLLSGDALLVAVMQANGLRQLASNDSDFDAVASITRFRPV